jgi:hypothetical protein
MGRFSPITVEKIMNARGKVLSRIGSPHTKLPEVREVMSRAAFDAPEIPEPKANNDHWLLFKHFFGADPEAHFEIMFRSFIVAAYPDDPVKIFGLPIPEFNEFIFKVDTNMYAYQQHRAKFYNILRHINACAHQTPKT